MAVAARNLAMKTVHIRELSTELRKTMAGQVHAVQKGMELAAKIDVDRWIQWSLRGGGYTGPRPYRVPVDTGDYARSWKSDVEPMEVHGGRVSGPGRIAIYSAASPPVKAGVIEHGRRPAPIPLGPLADWVRRKLGVSDPKVARGIAFAISRKASKVRRPGLEVLARAHPKIAAAVEKRVAAELKKAAR